MKKIIVFIICIISLLIPAYGIASWFEAGNSYLFVQKNKPGIILDASGWGNSYARIQFNTDNTFIWLAGAYHDAIGNRGFDISNNFYGQGDFRSFLNIANNGQVGINNNNPQYALDINGGIHNQGAALTTDCDSGGAPPAQWVLRGQSNNNQQMLIGYNTTLDYGSIQVVKQGSSAEPLYLNPLGGFVTIGTSTVSKPLVVALANSGGEGGTITIQNTAPLTIGNLAGLDFRSSIDGSGSGRIRTVLINTLGDSEMNFRVRSTTKGGEFEAIRISSLGAFLVNTTSTGTNNLMEIKDGHIANTMVTPPSTTSCGNNPTPVGTDADGIITITGVGVTTCTLTFTLAWNTIYTCSVTSGSATTAAALPFTTSTSTANVVFGMTAVTNPVLIYHCSGK
jgi:hypothetical protein